MGLFNRGEKHFSEKTEYKDPSDNVLSTEHEKAFAYMDVRELEDASKRIPLMIEFAEAGVPLALYEVGEMYLRGNEIECNVDKGKEYLLKAGQKGASNAITVLAHFCICEAFDEVKAEKVEQFGQDACMKRFGEKYDIGVAYLAWALSKGNISAIETYTGFLSLGWNEGSFGETLKRATTAAFEPYRKQLIEEETDAGLYILGILSLRGVAMPQNLVAAKAFLEKSAAHGNTNAKTELENPLFALLGEEDEE